METFRSDLSGNEFPLADKISGNAIRKSILGLIQKDSPQFTDDQFLSVSELNQYREKYISASLLKETGELSELENIVLNSFKSEATLTDKLDGDEKQDRTPGQIVADKVAKFGGSWPFIISFGIFLFLWIALNAFLLSNKGFDPFPYILLNLILSCLAAIQAPVIMMSQNRQEEKDRDRAKNDYMINLKSELEIRMLHEKIDHLIMHQQQDLFEMQNVQIEMLEDVLKRIDGKQV